MTTPTSLALAPEVCESPPVEDPELERIAREYTAAEALADDLRPKLYARIYDFRQQWGTQRGWQGWIVERTGLTRERVRQIITAEEKRRGDIELPEGVTTRIDGKTSTSPGHRIYSVVADARIDEVARVLGSLPHGLRADNDGTHVDVMADAERITRIRQLLIDAGIGLVN